MARTTVPAYRHVHILGDSFTAGLYATTGNSYRDLLTVSMQTLNPLNASLGMTAASVVGARLVDQPSQTAGALGANYGPDLLIFAIGQNDTNVGLGITEDEFRTAAETMTDYALDTMRVPVVVSAIPCQPSWGWTERGQLAAAFNEIWRETAESRGMPFLAGWTHCLTAAGLSKIADVPAEATAADGYHPNNTGHQQLHDALWAELEPIMRRGLRVAAASRSAVARDPASRSAV